MKRQSLSRQAIEDSVQAVSSMFDFRLHEKGDGMLAGDHEGLGIITEEYFELVEAVKNNDLVSIRLEMTDLAVACLFGLATHFQHHLNEIGELETDATG